MVAARAVKNKEATMTTAAAMSVAELFKTMRKRGRAAPKPSSTASRPPWTAAGHGNVGVTTRVRASSHRSAAGRWRSSRPTAAKTSRRPAMTVTAAGWDRRLLTVHVRGLNDRDWVVGRAGLKLLAAIARGGAFIDERRGHARVDSDSLSVTVLPEDLEALIVAIKDAIEEHIEWPSDGAAWWQARRGPGIGDAGLSARRTSAALLWGSPWGRSRKKAPPGVGPGRR